MAYNAISFAVTFYFSNNLMIGHHDKLSLHRHVKHQVRRLKSCQFLSLQQSVATPWSLTLLDFPKTLDLGFRQMISLLLHAV